MTTFSDLYAKANTGDHAITDHDVAQLLRDDDMRMVYDSFRYTGSTPLEALGKTLAERATARQIAEGQA